MCTSILSNRNKTIVGWNLDLLDMEHRVRVADDGVFIEINDPAEGWMPLFGANDRGDFVGMPTCWPYDARSDPKGNEENVIRLNIDLLQKRKSLSDIYRIAETDGVCSIPGTTFMSALSDKDGNLLHIVPGQGCRYYAHPRYQLLTNFSPFKMDREKHPWMGWDRYRIAEEMLMNAGDDFDADECFAILKKVSQEACPTVVSMVFDASEMTVYYCENRDFDRIKKIIMGEKHAV